jgi:ribosomal protein L37AE/L43A
MSQTAGGSWQCHTCGYSQLSASTTTLVDATCPSCEATALYRQETWVRCGGDGCRYEIDADAYGVFRQLVAEWETDPDSFFARVEARTAELRAAEPVWR